MAICKRLTMLCVAALTCATARAQWEILESNTTASLRGIQYVGNGIAWASGSEGTVLRTTDMGKTWTLCAVPPEAEVLDFRGVQAFDDRTALVMSSGRRDLSRIYKTTDGCATWKRVATNPDAQGFFDTLVMVDRQNGYIFGDAVNHQFVLERTSDGGEHWPGLVTPHTRPDDRPGQALEDLVGRGAFAASNSAFTVAPQNGASSCTPMPAWFGTSGPQGAKIFRLEVPSPGCAEWSLHSWKPVDAPIAGENSSSGVFAIAAMDANTLVAVGGNYQDPEDGRHAAVFSQDGGRTWTAAAKQPNGYRSAVAYDAAAKAWIAVGPNGTDVSFDNGHTWRELAPYWKTDARDADTKWNALSLPFAVGSNGRIGLLRATALVQQPPGTKKSRLWRLPH